MRTLSLFTSAAFLACVSQQVHLQPIRGMRDEEDAAKAIEFRKGLGEEYEELVDVTNRMLVASNFAVRAYKEAAQHRDKETNHCADLDNLNGKVLQDLLTSMSEKVHAYVEKYLSDAQAHSWSELVEDGLKYNPLIPRNPSWTFGNILQKLEIVSMFDNILTQQVEFLELTEQTMSHSDKLSSWEMAQATIYMLSHFNLEVTPEYFGMWINNCIIGIDGKPERQTENEAASGEQGNNGYKELPNAIERTWGDDLDEFDPSKIQNISFDENGDEQRS